ncbi:MAG: GspE/PulE family protein [Magnetospiraceae bacterium]
MTLPQDRAGFEGALAERLVGGKVLGQDALDRARRLVDSGEGDRLEAVLCQLGLIGEAEMTALIADVGGFELANGSDIPDAPVAPEKLTAGFLKESRLLPLSLDGEALRVAMVDPFDSFARQALELTLGVTVLPLIAPPALVEAGFRQLYGAARAEAVADLGPVGDAGGDVERLRDQASEAPVVKLVNGLINQAVEARASDIHLEPTAGRLRVRFRIDGLLREMETPPATLAAAIISRIKIMARLDIAERRLPQDGRIRLAVRGREVDFRVATTPTIHGEGVVLRVLDRGGLTLDFPSLGFTDQQEQQFKGLLKRPNGVLLVTGPTGSGKSTTLYAALSALNAPGKKLIAIEDPVEYQLEGVNQIQVQPRIGLDFATLLRSILRQDPDIIMVGEIRDLETARIATQAALTGHLVLSTLHTNSAAAAATRLLDMGVEPYLLASTLIGAVGQRLVRALCTDCRESRPPTESERRELRLDQLVETRKLHFGSGCSTCGGTGYKGRTALLELLPMSDGVRRLVLDSADAGAIQAQAVAEGMAPLYQDGMAKAMTGLTSVEEVLRVTREI